YFLLRPRTTVAFSREVSGFFGGTSGAVETTTRPLSLTIAVARCGLTGPPQRLDNGMGFPLPRTGISYVAPATSRYTRTPSFTLRGSIGILACSTVTVPSSEGSLTRLPTGAGRT